MRVGRENSKKVKRDKKKVTRYYRYPSSRKSYLVVLLLDLVSIYDLLLPNYKTDNDVQLAYPALPTIYEKEQEEVLLYKLVHYNTLINRVHRQERSCRIYVSVEEDVLAALTMLEELVRLSQQSVTERRDEYLLLLINKHVEKEEEFRVGELYRMLGISRKRLQESLARLTEEGKVVRVAGNRYSGYVYKVK